MTKELRNALDVALDLGDSDRVRLAEELVRSLDDAERERIEKLWYAEARQRFEAHRRGEIGSTPADEVIASLLKGRK